MGRGLSDLQATVLRLAYQNLPARLKVSDVSTEGMQSWSVLGGSNQNPHKRENSGADVYYHEILEAAYGWRANLPARISIGSCRFSKAEIGVNKYRAAMNAVSRAVLRLAQRGLVYTMQGKTSHWSGANLTECGIRVAKSLAADSTVDPLTYRGRRPRSLDTPET